MGRPGNILDRLPLKQRDEPPPSRVDYQVIYADTDGKLYRRKADGTTVEIGGGVHVTTAGDIEYHDGTSATRLPVGTNGQVLSVDTSLAGKLKWIAPAVAALALSAGYDGDTGAGFDCTGITVSDGTLT